MAKVTKSIEKRERVVVDEETVYHLSLSREELQAIQAALLVCLEDEGGEFNKIRCNITNAIWRTDLTISGSYLQVVQLLGPERVEVRVTH